MKKFFMADGTGCIGRADTEYMLNHGYPVAVFGSLVFENAEAIIPSVWKRMAKLPDGYRVC